MFPEAAPSMALGCFVPILSPFCPRGQICPRFVSSLRERGQIVLRTHGHWPQAPYDRKNKEGRSGYLSLILPPFVPWRQIEKRLQYSQRADRGQNALICLQNPLHSYTLTYTYPP